MKTFLSTVLVIASMIAVSTCGRRTAPVPYQTPEPDLPKVQLDKPVFKGKRLLISWQLEQTNAKTSPPTFLINLFHREETCPVCDSEPFLTYELKPGDDPSLLTGGIAIQTGSYVLRRRDMAYRLYLEENIYGKWNSQGLYNLSLTYQNSEGVYAEPSAKVWPTYSQAIAKPELKILSRSKVQDSTEQIVVFQWTLVPEFIYRTISDKPGGLEKTRYFGLNLYRVDINEAENWEQKLTDQPLRGGHYLIKVGRYQVFACLVDRYGNESQTVLLIDNTR